MKINSFLRNYHISLIFRVNKKEKINNSVVYCELWLLQIFWQFKETFFNATIMKIVVNVLKLKI